MTLKSILRRLSCLLVIGCLFVFSVACSGNASEKRENKVIGVWIDLSSYRGQVHSIIQEPFAWQNESMTKAAPRVRYEVEKGIYTYADEWQNGKYYYEYECAASLKELYIQPPTVEIALPENELSVPAIEGEVVTRDGSPWFTIDEVHATAGELVISFFIEDSHPTVLPFVDGIVAEGSVSTSEKTENGYSYQIRVPYIDGKEIVADDVFLCVTQIETIIAVDAIYTSDSDVELIPIRGKV